MIRAGIGGWTFEPWRGGNFFPKGHAKSPELQFSSRKVSSIEMYCSFY